MTENGTGVGVDELDAREIPTPGHSWSTTKRAIQEACAAGEHDWVELTGFDTTGYWRECKTCGIADVTAAALGQDVETPNINQREGVE